VITHWAGPKTAEAQQKPVQNGLSKEKDQKGPGGAHCSRPARFPGELKHDRKKAVSTSQAKAARSHPLWCLGSSVPPTLLKREEGERGCLMAAGSQPGKVRAVAKPLSAKGAYKKKDGSDLLPRRPRN